jgi:hypothetical protein
MEREYENVRAPEQEKAETAAMISQMAELRTVYFQMQVSDVLHTTSLGSSFFSEAMEYFEKYEDVKGFAPFPPDEQFELFTILKRDFAKFNARLEGLKASYIAHISPIDRKLRIHLNIETRGHEEEKAALAERGMPYELGRYAFIRSVKAESYRTVLRDFFKTFEADFAAISRRAFSHRIDISIIRSMK